MAVEKNIHGKHDNGDHVGLYHNVRALAEAMYSLQFGLQEYYDENQSDSNPQEETSFRQTSEQQE